MSREVRTMSSRESRAADQTKKKKKKKRRGRRTVLPTDVRPSEFLGRVVVIHACT